MSMKNSNDIIVHQTRDLPTCSAVSQTTVPPCTPNFMQCYFNLKNTRVHAHSPPPSLSLLKKGIRGQTIKKPKFFFNLLLYLQLNQTCHLQTTPLHSIHCSQHFFHFCNMSWKVFCGTAWRYHIEFSSISSTVWNRWPYSEDFHFGNKKKSTGNKSGE